MSTAEIQEKISAARREADGLKDKIRAAKDQTADTSCELLLACAFIFRTSSADCQQYGPWQTTLPLSRACP